MRGADGMPNDASQQWDWSMIRRRCRAEAMRMVRRHQEADEIVQAALMRAWRSRETCRTPEAPLAWCVQITRNEALRLIARERATSAEPLEQDAPLPDRRALDDVEGVAGRVDVARALDQLTPQDRALILLRYMQDRSHPEIAAQLRIPEATARVRLHRAQKRLRSLLEDAA
jgi:RNA polymerase sigma-70 factor, ECF subfamily